MVVVTAPRTWNVRNLAALLALCLVGCGCDGHVRSFNPFSDAEMVDGVGSEPEQKLVEVLTSVAKQRGYTQAKPTIESKDYTVILWFSKQVNRDSVEIKLTRDTKTGELCVVLLDWPSFTRSTESVEVEKAIREKLAVQ